MKLWKTALFAAAIVASAALFNGCVVPCLSPLFEEKEALFEPALLGKWLPDDKDAKETFEFSRVTDKNQYRIVNRNKDGRQATLSAMLGKLGDRQYLCAVLDQESLPEHSVWFACPLHVLIFRIEQTTPELKLTMLNFEACKKLLAEKPAVIAHVMLKPTEEKEKDAIPFLTASTAELQKFIKEYADSAKLFPADQVMTFVRPAAEKPAAPTAKPADSAGK